MIYDELYRRFGSLLATKIMEEIAVDEFSKLTLDQLVEFFEQKASRARAAYFAIIGNPFVSGALDGKRADYASQLYNQWKSADRLSYLISVAEEARRRVSF